MSVFGKKLRECREAKSFSQSKLANEVGVHQSIIGRYEREEAKPTIDVVINLAKALDTTVGYLLGENKDADLFKDPVMLNRFKDINSLPDNDKHCILYALDGLLQNYKAKKAYS
jgi:transcriptional regulator with XRE-family HTH domain